MRADQIARIHSTQGFIAALDQSGGSTPKALKLYGVDESQYASEDEMFALVHEMRTRIITSPSFSSSRILAVILFENTMQSKVDAMGTAEFLWKVKGIPSFLKVDNGLQEEVDGVRLMKNIPQLKSRLAAADDHGVIGTKMRSVIKFANSVGIEKVLDQQFAIAQEIIAAGLIPIIEPEVDIESPEKAAAEKILLIGLKNRLDLLPAGAKVVLKLTLPEERNLYRELLGHRSVLRIAALSGGYSREEANKRLRANDGLIASFSRALTEGLKVQQSEEEFDEVLDQSIASIYSASIEKIDK
jgi:fructose-bisphosphate aldolase class I